MIVYFIRHGETDWNKKGKLQGRVDVSLNDEGRRVAELTRDALKNVSFDIAFSSPLSRAYETAEIILRGKEIPIIKDERLIEVGFGKYEGVKKINWDENINNFFRKSEKYMPRDGGETLEEVLERERDFLQTLFRDSRYQKSTVLVSTHGAALSGLLTVIKGNPVSKFWDGGLHKNCGISIVDVKDGIPRIVKEAIVVYDEKE